MLEIFKDMDSNGDGLVYKLDFKKYLQKLGKVGWIDKDSCRDHAGSGELILNVETKEDCLTD